MISVIILLLPWSSPQADELSGTYSELKIEIPDIDHIKDPIEIKFSENVIPPDESGLDIDDIKSEIISSIYFIPPLKGEFRWKDSKNLAFIPTSNQLGWGADMDIRISPIIPFFGSEFSSKYFTRSLSLPRFRAGGKVVNWDTIMGAPRFITSLGDGKYKKFIGKGPYYLLFDQPADIFFIKDFIELNKADWTKIAYSISRPTNVGEKFDLDIEDEYVIAITIDEDLNHNEEIILSIPSWRGHPDNTEPEIERRGLVYKSLFQLDEATWDGKLASGRMSLKSKVHLKFSSFFDYQDFQRAFKIEPEPVKQNIIYYRDDYVRIDLELQPGQKYDISLPYSFSDFLGNPLREAVNIAFQAQDLPPEFSVPDKPVTIEPSHISIPFKGLNLETVEVKIYSFSSANAYIRARELRHKPTRASAYGLTESDLAYSQDLSDWILNENTSDSFKLDRPLTEGFKCFEFIGRGKGSEKKDIERTVLVNVSETGITAKVSKDKILVWLASFSSGEALPNIPIELFDLRGNILGEGQTDSHGLSVITPQSNDFPVKGDDSLYLVAKDKSIMVLRNDELSSPWQFNLPGIVNDNIPLRGSIFTERGVYRPGDKVYIKTYTYSGDVKNMNIVVRDPRSKEILKTEMVRDEYGASDFEIEIPEGSAVGRYDIIVSNGSSYISSSFKVEEYRVPTFVVSVDDRNRKWTPGEPVNVDIESRYYHGGTMGNRDFNWKVTRVQSPLHLSSFPGYVFQSAEDATLTGIFLSHGGLLNAEGKQTVSFTPAHHVSAGRMKYTFEAVVTDTDRQAYSSRLSRVVHPAGFYVGVKPPAREVVRSNTKVVMPFVVVDTAGKVMRDTDVDVQVEYIEYHSTARQYQSSKVQMFNRMVGDTVLRESLTSGAGPEEFSYTPSRAGIYRFNFDATDSKGNKVRTSTYLTVSGDESTAWPRFDIEKIDIVKDKESYEIGDTAVLIPQTPYKKATALVTIEVNGVIETRIINIDNNTPEIKIPILAEYAPNVFISTIIVRGREHFMKDASGFETGAPGFKVGYVKLDVDPSRQRLNVLVDKRISNVSPGEKVTIPIQVKNYSNEGTQAQLTAMVVDEAVLDMTAYLTPNPLDTVYAPRALGVRTGSNWLDLPHSRRERLEKIFPGGDDDEVDLTSRSDLEAILRNLFKSTAYWNPDLKTDASGKAEITFTMPDNLTSYRVMVVAADKKMRFGSSDHMLVNQQALMIQPVIPRFIYPEDELQVEAMVFNNTSKREEITLKAEFEGLKLISQKDVSKVIVAPGKSANIPFRVKAGISGTAKVRFIASTASHRDAGEYTVPIISPGTSVSEVKSVKVLNDNKVSLKLPDYYIKGTAKSELVLSVTELTELKGAVQYLMRYPNGCIEQTTSTAYPLVVLKELLPVIGVEVNQEDLKKFSEAGVKRILSFQTSKGGLAYWPGSDSPHAFATAFGLTALIAAKERGYDVPDSALAGMADYLEQALRSGQITESIPHGNIADGDTRALFVMTLGRLGRPQPQYINALWENRSKLTGFGFSFLAIAVGEMEGGDQSLLQPILQAIKDNAKKTAKEAYFDSKAKGGWSMDSPLRTHGASLIAFGSSDSDREMTGKLMEGLLARRRGQMWGNTQENVFGIMGISQVTGSGSHRRGSLGDIPHVSILLKDKNISLSTMEAPDEQVRRITYSDAELGLMPGDMVTAEVKGNVPNAYLSLRLNYEIPLEKTDLSAKAKGFTLVRKYETLDGKPVDLKAIPLGSLVKVRV
ncbi:MAG: MG2 domain-containing protein, partial [Deltaproteobacteria bacterium]|nr:MG2 domain-containing protein [Deltaproteobacteria bacterium]